MGQKFAQNCSISYHFEDIFNVLFSAKIQDGHQKWRKLKFFPLHRILLYYPVGQKCARNRSISYSFRDIHTFSFSIYSLWLSLIIDKVAITHLAMGIHFQTTDHVVAVAKIKFFSICIGYSCTTLWVKNSLKIALSLTISKIFSMFYFPLKSKMATKSGEN